MLGAKLPEVFRAKDAEDAKRMGLSPFCGRSAAAPAGRVMPALMEFFEKRAGQVRSAQRQK